MLKRMLAGYVLVAAAALAASQAGAEKPVAGAGRWRIERVVVVMRHGVRPPTKDPAMPAGTADAPWPQWPVRPGYLTPHGAAAIGLIAGYDRRAWPALLPSGACPGAGAIRIIADSDQRTIATGQAYAEGLAPGCTVTVEHRPEGQPDPIFSPTSTGSVAIDPALAVAAIRATLPGGITVEEARLRPLLRRLDTILCARPATTCGVGGTPSAITPATATTRSKLTGALDRASTAGQILLLEYADGKPMAEVGWGRATAADIARLSEFHAVEFRVLARPRYLAKRNMALLSPLILDALTAPGPGRPAITVIAGHDTNVASLGGLLGVHWQVPGLAADDPSPGGAIVLEQLRDDAGHQIIRARYRSQTLDQIRTLGRPDRAGPYDAILPIAGCRSAPIRGACAVAEFRRVLAPR